MLGATVIEPSGKKLARAASYTAVGLEMGVSVVIGGGAGWWLDEKLGTEPVFLIVGGLFGIAAAFWGLVRAAARARRDMR